MATIKSMSSSMKSKELLKENSGLLKKMLKLGKKMFRLGKRVLKLGWRKKYSNVVVEKGICSSNEPKNQHQGGENLNEVGNGNLPQVVTTEIIEKDVSIRSDDSTSDTELNEILLEVEEAKERIIKRFEGQNHVIEPIVASIQQDVVRLSDPTKPIGSFLLVGDSGVTTTFVKVLFEELGYDEEFLKECLMAIDMINYSDEISSISNFVGAPGIAFQLSEQVRGISRSIFVFERIEKGATEVLDLLHSITNSARLIDVKGREIDFSDTMVFMTYNTDSHVQENCEEIPLKEFRSNIVQKVRTQLNEKFLQDIQILVFDNPSDVHWKKILEAKVLEISKLLKVHHGLQCEISPCAIDTMLAKIPKPIGVKAMEKWLDDDFKMALMEKILDPHMPQFSKIFVGVKMEATLEYDICGIKWFSKDDDDVYA